MKPCKLFYVAAVGLSLFSCAQKEGMELDPPTLAPIVRLGEEVLPNAVMVKMSTPLDAAQLQALEIEQGVTLQKVFTSTPGKEELERQFGLDRWYEALLPETKGADDAVRQLAALPGVELVEYESVVQKDWDGTSYPGPESATKAENTSFNDPYLSYQWHYKNTGKTSISRTAKAGADVNVSDVWANLCTGDPDIIVAVVDEGVKYSHPDLADNMWTNTGEIPGNGIDDDNNGYIDDVHGFNFVTKGPVSWDVVDAGGNGDSGHGTHCAGTIAAVNNNGKGVAGIAGGSGNKDGCRIMSCQIFSGKGGGSVKIVTNAIMYAADMGASVISCSFGYSVAFTSDDNYISRQGSAEIDAIHYFEASCNNPVLDGNIAIFAAGNENHNYAHYPGAFYDIISVSAFGPDGLPTYYTNYGPGCNISAPGGEAYHRVNLWDSMVLSTLPSELPELGIDGAYNKGLDYGYMQGTSMACPHVSGVVALGLSYAKKLGKHFTRDEFKRMILASVNDIDQRIGSISEKTYAYGRGALAMAPYYHQMGTGAIDAWRLMMHIEGLPTLTSTLGKQQWIDLTSIFGTASTSLTYLSVEVPASTASSLGLEKITPTNTEKYPAVVDGNGYAYIQFGRLYIHPSKIGSGTITIAAVGGGDHVGGGSNPPGGMTLTQTVSLIARDTDGGNGTGGWL